MGRQWKQRLTFLCPACCVTAVLWIHLSGPDLALSEFQVASQETCCDIEGFMKGVGDTREGPKHKLKN